MSRALKDLRVSEHEAAVIRDALVYLTQMTADELHERFGWSVHEQNALSTAIRKVKS